MEYALQIGKVIFRGELPFPYKWRAEDQQFLKTDAIAKKQVMVYSVGETLKEPDTSPLARQDFARIWKQKGEEIRAFDASFYPGHPAYAVTRRRGEELRIAFTDNINILNNPNMQLWNLLQLENFLLETEGIVLHCCYTMYREEAILFTAPSGTGKTTQANIWKKCYGSQIINGDKCLLQRHEAQWQAWGFPLHGSAQECENQRYPIRTIAVVRQDKTDWVEEVNPARRLGLLYSECTVNSWDQERVQMALELLTDLVMKVNVVIIHCTMEDNAAHVLHEYLYGGKHGTI